MAERLLKPGEHCPVCNDPLAGYEYTEFNMARIIKVQRLPLPSDVRNPVGNFNCAEMIADIVRGDPVSKYLDFLESIANSDVPAFHIWNLLPTIPRDFGICSRFWLFNTGFSLGIEAVSNEERKPEEVKPEDPKPYVYSVGLYGARTIGDDEKFSDSKLVDLARLEIDVPLPEHI